MTLREDIQTELDRREGKRIAKEVLARMTEPPRFTMFSGVFVVMSGNYITSCSGQSIVAQSVSYTVRKRNGY